MALDVKAEVICAGSYTTSQAEANWPEFAFAILKGGADNQATIQDIGSTLEKNGFHTEASSVVYWVSASTTVTTSQFSDMPGFAEMSGFPTDAVLIMSYPNKG